MNRTEAAGRYLMEEKSQKKSNKILLIAVLILGAVVAAVCIPALLDHYEKEQKKQVVEEARAYFENDIPNDIEKAYEGFSIPGTLDIKTESEWGNSSLHHKPVYYWEDTLTVTLRTDTGFDELEEREKYNAISDFGWTGIDAFQKVMEEKFPGYFSSYKLTAGVYDRTVLFYIKYHFYIKTPRCTYRYLGEPDSYGIGTGDHVHRLTDPQSRYYVDPNKPKATPKPTAAPKPRVTYTPGKYSSLYGNDTDPDEAHLYDDPDEYADRYAEEFADEMGEDADEGYQEAYDHWLYWHESHG